jgi:hypothetical protein
MLPVRSRSAIEGDRPAAAPPRDTRPHPMIDTPDQPPAPEADSPAAKSRSGGPRTPEGKLNSRKNALKHGLRAQVLLPDDLAEAAASRTAELAAEFQPQSPYEDWLIGQMGTAAAQLDRCAELKLIDLRRCIDRVRLCWEQDRGALVEDLARIFHPDT